MKNKRLRNKRLKRKKLSEMHNQIIRYSVVFLLFAALTALYATLFFLSDIPTAYTGLPNVSSEEKSFSQGEIYSISIDPEEPSVLDDIIINIDVRNTADELNEYVLNIFISKDGQVKDENYFTFRLYSNKKVLLSPTFTPPGVGKYKIVVKLYDKYKSVLYDTKVLEITVISDIGPFDLSLDILSRTVRPNDEIPLIISMKNIGVKGTDVHIVLSIDCLEQEDIYKEFFVFLKGGGEVDKFSTITACNEDGSHDITAKLILSDHTFAYSLTQAIVSRTYYDFDVELQKSIKIKQGESRVFDVYIKNTVETTLNNLRLGVENIPLEWTTITPSVISSIKPNETAMFLVNISIPEDASIIEYPTTVDIGSDEVLVQKDFTLEVISGRFSAKEEITSDSILYPLTFKIVAAFILISIGLIVFQRLRLMRNKSKKLSGK